MKVRQIKNRHWRSIKGVVVAAAAQVLKYHVTRKKDGELVAIVHTEREADELVAKAKLQKRAALQWEAKAA